MYPVGVFLYRTPCKSNSILNVFILYKYYKIKTKINIRLRIYIENNILTLKQNISA